MRGCTNPRCTNANCMRRHGSALMATMMLWCGWGVVVRDAYRRVPAPWSPWRYEADMEKENDR